MIDAIIRGMLGEAGSALLDLYLQNAYWINAIVLIYAICLILAQFGRRKVIAAIKSTLFDRYGDDIENKNDNWYKKILEKNDLDWNTIANQTWIPIISTGGILGFRIKKPENLRQEFTPEKIYDILNKKEDH